MDRNPVPVAEPQPNPHLDLPDAEFRARLLDCLYDGVYFVDRHRTITYWNRGAEELTGFKAEEIVGTQCPDDLLMHADGTGRHLCTDGCPLVDAIARGCNTEHDLTLRHKAGHRVPVRVRVAPIRNEKGEFIGAVEVFSDSTHLKAVERRAGEMETLAFRDPLTSLPNRRFSSLKVEQALEEVRQFGRQYGLIMVDVDRFKCINDRWGHRTGDIVLIALANLLTESVRPADTVGRWGGEEFLILIADVTAPSFCDLAARCCALVAERPVQADQASIPLTISAGATLLHAADTAESAVQRADRLMYQSKVSGRNQVRFG
jgi:diguanylate cyclase (GGDEF)-like protein/PAS domain S-box-containing protein